MMQSQYSPHLHLKTHNTRLSKRRAFVICFFCYLPDERQIWRTFFNFFQNGDRAKSRSWSDWHLVFCPFFGVKSAWYWGYLGAFFLSFYWNSLFCGGKFGAMSKFSSDFPLYREYLPGEREMWRGKCKSFTFIIICNGFAQLFLI